MKTEAKALTEMTTQEMLAELNITAKPSAENFNRRTEMRAELFSRLRCPESIRKPKGREK